jgi:uncharacterized membrane protein YkvA (DUF1232 family)
MSSASSALRSPGFRSNLRLSWRLFRDPRVPTRLKAVPLVVAVLYVLSPIDAVPDFLLGIGQVDDVGMVGLAVLLLTLLPRFAPRDVVAAHRAAMGGYPSAARPAADREVVDVPHRVRR